MELRLLPPQQQTLVWCFTRDSLSFDANERGDFARPFAVGGRESVERIVQFADSQGAALRLQPGVPTSAVVLVRFADRKYLAPVTTAMLRMPDVPITNDAMVSFAGEEYLRPLRAFWQSRMRRTLFRWRLWWDQRRHARAHRS